VILIGDAAEDGSSLDAGGVEVDDRGGGVVWIVVGEASGDALVGPCGVVVGHVFRQNGMEVFLVEDQGVVE